MTRDYMVSNIREMCCKARLNEDTAKIVNNLEVLSTGSLKILEKLLEYGLEAGNDVNTIFDDIKDMDFIYVHPHLNNVDGKLTLPLKMSLHLHIEDNMLYLYSDTACKSLVYEKEILNPPKNYVSLNIMSMLYKASKELKIPLTRKIFSVSGFTEIFMNFVRNVYGHGEFGISAYNICKHLTYHTYPVSEPNGTLLKEFDMSATLRGKYYNVKIYHDGQELKVALNDKLRYTYEIQRELADPEYIEMHVNALCLMIGLY